MAAATVTSTKERQERSNYARLCCLLVQFGTQALRNRFDKFHPPGALHSALTLHHHATLLSLRKRRIINQIQWSTLSPTPPVSSVSSEDFDITLLMILLRNICGLTPPVTGWDALPALTDTSLEADIARVKYFRNTIFAHAKKASVDDATYSTSWLDIRDTLVRLGGTSFEADINDLQTKCLDPGVEENYKKLLEQWKEDENNIKDMFEEVSKKLDDLRKEKETKSTGQPPRDDDKPKSELPEKPVNVHGHVTEVGDIVQALSNDSSKAVAAVLVSGITGIGKTTVAIQAGYQLKDKCGCIVKFCSLRCARSDEEKGEHKENKVERELREILNVCVPGHQQTNENPRHVLLNWCRRLEHELILVLDGAEDAVEGDVENYFIELLKEMRMCSQFKLKFLITSRRSDIDIATTSLNVENIKIGPLDQGESIQVLKDGAKLQSDSDPDTQSNLSKIAELCEHVPLALRLAGPLLSSDSEYTFQELIPELEKNLLKTLQLRRIMEIAFEQLDEPLQRALVCLSVFVRSFDKEAATALLGAQCPEMLTNLRRRNLIEKQKNRHHLHVLIRDYARQIGKIKFKPILDQGRQAFRKHFLSLILRNTRKYWEKDACKISLDLFDGDRLNFEFALKNVGSMEKFEDCTKELENVVNECWLVAPYIGDCIPFMLYDEFLKGLLHFSKSQGNVIHEVQISCLLYHEGRKCGGAKQQEMQDLFDRVIKLHDENSHLFEQNGLSEVFYLSHYGRYLSQDCNQREKALTVLEQALSIHDKEKRQKPESTYDKAIILGQMGINAKELGRRAEACENYSEALKFRQEHYGNHVSTAFAHKEMADYYLHFKQFSKAEENYNRAIQILKGMKIAEHKEAIPIFKNWGICFEQSGKPVNQSRKTYEKGSEIADSTIEGNHKWKVWIKTYLALLLYTNYQDEVSTANRIAKEVLQMGKELELKGWPRKEELEETYQKH